MNRHHSRHATTSSGRRTAALRRVVLASQITLPAARRAQSGCGRSCETDPRPRIACPPHPQVPAGATRRGHLLDQRGDPQDERALTGHARLADLQPGRPQQTSPSRRPARQALQRRFSPSAGRQLNPRPQPARVVNDAVTQQGLVRAPVMRGPAPRRPSASRRWPATGVFCGAGPGAPLVAVVAHAAGIDAVMRTSCPPGHGRPFPGCVRRACAADERAGSASSSRSRMNCSALHARSDGLVCRRALQVALVNEAGDGPHTLVVVKGPGGHGRRRSPPG